MATFDKIKGINIASNFKLQAETPLDGRLVVDTIADRDALVTEHGAYEGMTVYVKADKKKYILTDLSNAVWICEQDTVSELTNDMAALQDDVDGLAERKLETKRVDNLLSSSAVYNFDDRKPLFSVPAINGAEKGTSSVVEDENGCYQAVEVGTGTIGSTSNVYSQFKLGSIAENASKITLEFDFEYEHNGRMKLAIADLDVINSLSNSDIRWNTKGIAADVFSNSNNNFQINGKDALRASFFGTWLHAKFVMDFSERKVQYTITSKDNTADTLEGNVDFRDTDCAKITGIAVYTWLQNDKLYIDNINITALYDARENTRYIVGTGGVYKEYTYIDGVPVLVGRSDAVSPDGVKALVTDKADKQTVSGGFVAGRDADVLKVDGTPLEYYYVGQYKGGERTTYVSGNPKALFDKDNTGSSVDSAAQIFNVFDLGKPVDISAVTLYVSDAGADGANMVCLENELSVGAVRHDVLRTDGKPQSSVPVIENKLDTDGYIKTGYTDGRYIGTYRYIMVYNWSSHCTASEIYVETDVKETPINAIQLGEGTNTKKKTLQVYDYMLLDEDGTIPSERLKTTNGGFSGGDASFSGNDTSGVVIGHYATNGGAGGAAVGSEANVTGNGAAVGYHASAKGGGAIGASATADNGFAGGMNASAGYGCAAGRNAVTKNGVAVGNDAKTQDSKGRAIDAIQLGAGTNSTEKTLKVYDYTLMNADGKIPNERLPITGISFGECTSANAATAKTMNIPGFELKDGATVVVRFANGHEAETGFTLNINDTGAKNVLVNGVDDFLIYEGIQQNGVVLLSYSETADVYVCVTPNNVDVANSANSLSVNTIGSEAQPVFFEGGIPMVCDMYNYQRNSIQRIGTWLDGTPIWRYAFDKDWNGTVEKNDIANYGEMQIPIQDFFNNPNNVFTLNATCFLRRDYTACYVDDIILPRSSGTWVLIEDTIANNIDDYEGYYGYIEFVTDESNIKK